MRNNQLVLVGAQNWINPSWHGGFYPEDMPEDWLLSYYNTQFQAVYLPASVWKTASDSTWAQWLHDSQEGFCFVLEPASEGRPPHSERVLVATSSWEREHIWWLDEMPDMRALAQRITKRVAIGEPLFVFSRSGNLGLLQQVNSLKQVMGY